MSGSPSPLKSATRGQRVFQSSFTISGPVKRSGAFEAEAFTASSAGIHEDTDKPASAAMAGKGKGSFIMKKAARLGPGI